MHPATPLIPAIWSSSKHAGDVKNPSPRCRRTTGPPNQNGRGEEKEGGGRMEEEGRGRARCDAEGRQQQHVSSTHPGGIVIDSFFSRSLAITVHKT